MSLVVVCGTCYIGSLMAPHGCGCRWDVCTGIEGLDKQTLDRLKVRAAAKRAQKAIGAGSQRWKAIASPRRACSWEQAT